MTLAEFVDKLAKEGTIDGNIAELIMSYHRKESKVPCAAIRDALMPIVGEMDEYHARCAVEVQCAHDKFWDEHEPQTIGDFSDRITDAVANLCGEIASNEVRERYKNARPIEEERATSGDCANAATSGDCAKLREAIMEIRRAMMKDSGAGPATELHATIDAITQAALAAPATAEKSSAVGDAAKLREALVKCREIALQWQADEAAGVAGTTDKPHARSAAEAVVDMEFEINAALSATPRNCDRFATVDEARKAHEVICEKYGKCHNGCPLNNEEHYSAFDCFEAWLFAPATEKEGGAK